MRTFLVSIATSIAALTVSACASTPAIPDQTAAASSPDQYAVVSVDRTTAIGELTWRYLDGSATSPNATKFYLKPGKHCLAGFVHPRKRVDVPQDTLWQRLNVPSSRAIVAFDLPEPGQYSLSLVGTAAKPGLRRTAVNNTSDTVDVGGVLIGEEDIPDPTMYVPPHTVDWQSKLVALSAAKVIPSRVDQTESTSCHTAVTVENFLGSLLLGLLGGISF